MTQPAELRFSKAKQVERRPNRQRFSRKAKATADHVYTLARDQARYLCWKAAEKGCEACGMRLTLEAAHIHERVLRAQGGSPLKLDNLVCLCGGCHLQGEHGQ